jgi:serine/threonine protein kinase
LPGRILHPRSKDPARAQFGGADDHFLDIRFHRPSWGGIVARFSVANAAVTSPADVQRFHAEAEASANLDHPNILPINEFVEHEGQHYFSMKPIEGANLPSFSRDAESSERSAGVADQRCAAHAGLPPRHAPSTTRTSAACCTPI